MIGAGMAGLTAASQLQDAGLAVRVLDKARGPGGRMSTRRAGRWRFDHGAQYFTARDPDFRNAVETWRARSLVAPWNPRIRVFGPGPADSGSSPGIRWVGVPGMSAIASQMGAGLDCRFGHRVVELSRQQGQWHLALDGGRTMRADSLVLTPPPAQAAELLGPAHPLYDEVRRVAMKPCLALMVAFGRAFDAGFDAAFVNTGPLSWVARNSSRPGREGATWVIHANPDWSRDHLDHPPDALVRPMLEAFQALFELTLPEPAYATVHRWRYALAEPGLDAGCLADPDNRLVVAGDWCAGNRVEGAWKSGMEAGSSLAA